jgi:hypothetical protein
MQRMQHSPGSCRILRLDSSGLLSFDFSFMPGISTVTGFSPSSRTNKMGANIGSWEDPPSRYISVRDSAGSRVLGSELSSNVPWSKQLRPLPLVGPKTCRPTGDRQLNTRISRKVVWRTFGCGAVPTKPVLWGLASGKLS